MSQNDSEQAVNLTMLSRIYDSVKDIYSFGMQVVALAIGAEAFLLTTAVSTKNGLLIVASGLVLLALANHYYLSGKTLGVFFALARVYESELGIGRDKSITSALILSFRSPQVLTQVEELSLLRSVDDSFDVSSWMAESRRYNVFSFIAPTRSKSTLVFFVGGLSQVLIGFLLAMIGNWSLF